MRRKKRRTRRNSRWTPPRETSHFGRYRIGHTLDTKGVSIVYQVGDSHNWKVVARSVPKASAKKIVAALNSKHRLGRNPKRRRKGKK